MAFKALLDACVLYKMGVRDTLLSIAHVGLFRPLWSADILEEVRRAWRRNMPRLTDEQWERLTSHMHAAFPDATVEGYKPLVDALDIVEKDRHVLAAAIVGKADAIVTENLPTSPPSTAVGSRSRSSTTTHSSSNASTLIPSWC